MNRTAAVLLFGIVLILVVLVQFKSNLEEEQSVTISFDKPSNVTQQNENNEHEVSSERSVASEYIDEQIFIDDKLHPLCFFQKLSKQKFNLENIKKFTSHLGPSVPFGKDHIFVIVVNDKQCPKGNYRIVRAALHKKHGWVVEKDIDCANTTLEEQLAYGVTIQGEILSINSEEGEINFAINGDGFFHFKCKDGEFLGRQGTFYLDNSGFLKNVFGCNVVDKNEDPMRVESLPVKFNEKGCAAGVGCFQIVPFAQLEKIKGFMVNTDLGLLHLSASGEKLQSLPDATVLQDVLEDQKYSLLVRNSQYADADIWENPPENLNCEVKK